MISLKLCPFCNGDDLKTQSRSYKDGSGESYYFVGCRNGACFITGPNGETLEKAHKFWNNRPQIQELQARLKATENLLYKLGNDNHKNKELHDWFCENADRVSGGSDE